MLRLLLRRFLLAGVTLVVISIVVFAATQALPGDAALNSLEKGATKQQLQNARHALRLDQPVTKQYVGWVRGMVSGNWGDSVGSTAQAVGRDVSVRSLLSSRIENSLFLIVIAALISIPLAIALGVFTAVKKDSVIDHGFSLVTLVLTAVPEFVVGIALTVILATGLLHVFPAVSLIPPGDHAWDHLDAVALPVATLVIAVVPYISRILRGSMIEVLQSEPVVMARLKGLPERGVIWRHAFPNGIVPAIQVIALMLAAMAGGLVVIEFLFSYPGIGPALTDAVSNRDLPVVQALALLIAAVYVFVNLAADVATILLTPRLRTSGR